MFKVPLLLRVIIAIVLGVLLGYVVPDFVVRLMNTFCGLFDQLLRFMIPLIIVGLVTPAIAEVGQRAGRMLLVTAALAYTFTVLSGLFAYGVSSTVFPSVLPLTDTLPPTSMGEDAGRLPFFTIAIPPLMDVMTSLVLSFFLGIGITVLSDKGKGGGAESGNLKTFGDFTNSQFESRRRVQIRAAGVSNSQFSIFNFFSELRIIVTLAIERVIIPLLPFYILGLFLNMTASGKVVSVVADFVLIVLIIFAATLVYLLLQYLVAGFVTRRNPLKLLRTMLPAYVTALGTASSAATIPVTLRQTLRNGVSEPVAGFTVPLCATIHLSGSTLKITSCAVALMLMQGVDFDFAQMMGFIMMLGVVMVAAPGVPGGAIMAALGVLEGVLGFNSGQQTMMITLYIAMDSFGTACNVTGDGAIALIVDTLHRLRKPIRISVFDDFAI